MAIYYDSKPVEVDTTFDPTSENAVSGVAVKEAIDEAVQSMYKPGGSILFSNLPELSVDVLGFVYNITDAFTTDTRFVEGAGTECAAGTNVVVVNTGTSQNPVYKFDILAAGAVQAQSDWAQSDTSAVDFIKNKPTIPAVNTAGTGINITNNEISVTDPTLINTATGTGSLTILGTSTSGNYSVNIGNGAQAIFDNGIAVGASARSTDTAGIAIGYSTRAAQHSIALGYGPRAYGFRTISIGGSIINSTAENTIVLGTSNNSIADSNKFFVANGNNNYELLDLTTGKIPNARLDIQETAVDNTTITKNASNQLQASAVMNARTGTDVMPIWQGTEQQWNTGGIKTWYNWAAYNIINNYTTTGDTSVTNNVASLPTILNSPSYLYKEDTNTVSGKTFEVVLHLQFANNTTSSSDDGQDFFVSCVPYSNTFENLFSGYQNVGLQIGLNVANEMRFRWVLKVNGTQNDRFNAASYSQIYTAVNSYNGNIYLKLVEDTDRHSYASYMSYDGEEWQSVSSGYYENTTSVTYTSPLFHGFRNLSGVAYSVVLEDCYVKLDGNTVWTPISSVKSGEVFTENEEPTTADVVYSAPNTASALTITSIGTGTITLSDNNTYTYDASGNQTTTISIGEAHPTWLCNINGVGVKVGNTLIADYTNTATFQTTSNLVTSVSSSSTDTQYPSAKLFYDTVGNIEATLDAIIAQGSNS